MNAIDNGASIALYQARASHYDAATRRMEPVRQRAVVRLALRPGDRVLDLGCGTGRSFGPILERIGPSGHLVAVDQSPDMLAIARARVAAAGWRNLTLVESPAEQAALAGPFDAMLMVYTPDVLRSRAALARAFGAARPGARVACAGMKFFPWWLAPLDLLVLIKAWGYAGSLDGYRRPWRFLAPHVEDLVVENMYGGIAFVAGGRCPGIAP
jgi:demethylmenaquinone methyltransferase/2-methoxy-6-polyprenyl-1,4-benzoquinol methylase